MSRSITVADLISFLFYFYISFSRVQWISRTTCKKSIQYFILNRHHSTSNIQAHNTNDAFQSGSPEGSFPEGNFEKSTYIRKKIRIHKNFKIFPKFVHHRVAPSPAHPSPTSTQSPLPLSPFLPLLSSSYSFSYPPSHRLGIPARRKGFLSFPGAPLPSKKKTKK